MGVHLHKLLRNVAPQMLALAAQRVYQKESFRFELTMLMLSFSKAF